MVQSEAIGPGLQRGTAVWGGQDTGTTPAAMLCGTPTRTLQMRSSMAVLLC
jgi:hypothetical protein